MALISIHYAIDVPRGSKIINPATLGPVILAGGIIDAVKVTEEGVSITFTDGGSVIVPRWLKLTVDQDTDERRNRIAFAHWVLGGGGL
jgi:hypothetical protein